MSPHEVIDLMELNAELLAALKLMVQTIREPDDIRFARAVIAKAEGK